MPHKLNQFGLPLVLVGALGAGVAHAEDPAVAVARPRQVNLSVSENTARFRHLLTEFLADTRENEWVWKGVDADAFEADLIAVQPSFMHAAGEALEWRHFTLDLNSRDDGVSRWARRMTREYARRNGFKLPSGNEKAELTFCFKFEFGRKKAEKREELERFLLSLDKKKK